ARPGAVLPRGQRIARAKLRGVESSGMLLSSSELGLSEDHSGLLILPRGTPVGKPLSELLGLPDVIFELNVTPNRPDALSHLGIARDAHARTGPPLQVPQPPLADGGKRVDGLAKGDGEDPERGRRCRGRAR